MQKRSAFIAYKLHYLVFWILLFFLWYFLRFEDYSSSRKAFLITALKVADLALMVCLTNYLLIPKFLYRKRYFLFAVLFIGMIVASSLLKMNIIGHILNAPDLLSWNGGWRVKIYNNIIPHFFLVIAGAAIKLMTDYIRVQQRITELAKEKAEAELNFLKSQINPHFLFNSLNTIYFQIDKNNPGARETLHKFSEMLRYQLYEMNGDSIPIEKEIRYLEDYVDLQRMRKDDNYAVSFRCSEDVKGFAIKPLLLIPFVENAFKHISHYPDRKNFIQLECNRNNGTFHFRLENSTDKNDHSIKSGGIGLNNVKRRLELLYPGKHTLEIKEEEDFYKVHLEIEV
ncbi:MAG TPA: sensor histidine kinase [Ferruginibacter sp.]|nr:sensor histidine kinase [Ferruginibacter sp.]